MSLIIGSSILGMGLSPDSKSVCLACIGEMIFDKNALSEVINNYNDNNVKIFNLLFVDDDYKLCPDFAADAAKCADLMVMSGKMNENTVSELNKHVDEFTGGLIKNVISESSELLAKIYVLNVVYFNAKWKSPFNSSKTMLSPFITQCGNIKAFDMMHGLENSWYFEDDNVQLAYKPYVDNNYCMVFVLPKKLDCNFRIDNIKDVDCNTVFDIENLEEYIQNMEFCAVEMFLPKFEQRFKCIERLSLDIAYQPINDEPANIYDNSVVNFVHECVVKVDEKETQAAAATTYYVAKCIKLAPKRRVVFNANRTFNYYIRDIRTKEKIQPIIFAGTYDGN